ncbi:MAG: LysR substrate-binding domain-containing protein [Roseovarius sp.]
MHRAGCFASRWLSPRLTRLFEDNPGISLRIEQINSLDMLKTVRVDMVALWGVGDWKDHTSERLLSLPAAPTANRAAAQQARQLGLAEAVRQLPLLRAALTFPFQRCNDDWRPCRLRMAHSIL